MIEGSHDSFFPQVTVLVFLHQQLRKRFDDETRETAPHREYQKVFLFLLDAE